jgi:helicase
MYYNDEKNPHSENLRVSLEYAHDSENNIVHISEREKTTGTKNMFCPLCKGELTAKNKKNFPIRKWHFAHKKDMEHEHSMESIIHLNATLKIYGLLSANNKINPLIILSKCPKFLSHFKYEKIPDPLRKMKSIRTSDYFSFNPLEKATHIELKKPYLDIVPDISIWNHDKLIVGIEIITTNNYSLKKEKFYAHNKIPVILIDASTINDYHLIEETNNIPDMHFTLNINDHCMEYCNMTKVIITKKMLTDHLSRKKENENKLQNSDFIKASMLNTTTSPKKSKIKASLPSPIEIIPEAPRMRIDSLPLPKEALEIYTKSGITELYPPQAEVVNKGLLEGKNILAAIPTACGKTLLAELAMLKNVLNGGKALYIVPLIALANEKHERFKQFECLGIKTGISTGELESKSEHLGNNDIIVCTSEKVDSMLRNGTAWLYELSIIVVDEVHLLGDPGRGPTLDIVLTKLRSIPNLQIVALSATIGNAQVLADWLNARLVMSEWRPTTLHEGIAISKAMNFVTGANPFQEEIKHETSDITANIVLDTIQENAQCLVFESSRRNCAGFAKKFSKEKNPEYIAINKLLNAETKAKLAQIAEDIEESSDTEDSKQLGRCIRNGTAFHHAGLNATQRKLVEDGFKANLIKLISCTPTLAAGLNLPARKVIIRSHGRYNSNVGMMEDIRVLEYKQMVGRAGRPHLDPCGYSLLLAKGADEIEYLKETFIFAKAEDIESYLRDEEILRSHVLGIISSRLAKTTQGAIDFFSRTFSAHTGDLLEFAESIYSCITFLKNEDMISEENGQLSATPLGELVSRMYINPLTAATIIHDLELASKKKMHLTALSHLQLICKSPDVRTLYVRNADETQDCIRFAKDHENQIIRVMDNHFCSHTEYEDFLESVKNTMILDEWIREVDTKSIIERYSIGEGDLHTLSDSAAWIAHAIKRIASLKKIDINYNSLDLRLKYGASMELVALLNIKGIGRKRARMLYNSGIKSVDMLKSSSFGQIADVLSSKKIAANIFKQLEMAIPIEETDMSIPQVTPPQKQKSLFDF